MQEEKIIMYDSPEAAQKINMDLWKASNGTLHVKEESARYAGSTHSICECGGIKSKSWTICDDCRVKLNAKRYSELPFREWDGNEPVCDRNGDKYFFSEEEIIDYLDENNDESIDLLICEPNNYSEIGSDYWSDNEPENGDGELPEAMQKALDNLNAVIATLPPQSYSPGKIRTTYKIANP